MIERWLRWMERRWGHLAVRHVAIFLIAPKILFLFTGAKESGSALIPARVIEDGEWIRILTFVCVPSTQSPIWFFFYAYLTYLFCNGIEQKWGAFRLNVYILITWLCAAVTPFLMYLVQPAMGNGAFDFVAGETTIFLAFAALYPTFTLNLFFILPVQVKYLAILAWAGFGFRIWVVSWPEKCVIVAVLMNYVLFFGASHVKHAKQRVEARHRRMKWERAIRRDDSDDDDPR